MLRVFLSVVALCLGVSAQDVMVPVFEEKAPEPAPVRNLLGYFSGGFLAPRPSRPVWVWGSWSLVREITCNETGGNVTHTFNASEFDSVNVNVYANVTVSTSESESSDGAGYSVSVTGPNSTFEQLKVQRFNSTLVFRIEEGCQETPLQIDIKMPSVKYLRMNMPGNLKMNTTSEDALELSLSGVQTAELELDVPALLTTVSGNTGILLSGSTASHTLTLQGDPRVDAFDLETQQSIVDVFGDGRVGVWSTESLRAAVRGNGLVVFKPVEGLRVTESVFGLGRVAALADGERRLLEASEEMEIHP
uniref:Putative auto-transporter adhesin head GIN domain-containing protein n=1 Tax=Chromera velia CCMP2878 TaxID=1169474 RepID=A0A0G4HC87_9ALVE|mmetsp:Transcript_3612/g.7457  ORF Transcript_3612/g.7457 Transcript_3612/m.7457 type:complete len:305 (+) Transcript_3612:117-1031(+)|eukprot:Cvel_6241.t1-p1 / transcript=Cvel_6241.t1 / gene=Cvel_6241 / organism=Chromera_velia_CCMP2878 / gene_product=hypothetical protein / transcript_product=hypothetical protein / location=Cvel_scaffold302:40430-41691(+) / protein_length=304 / sequence_SO=supercontig / SO=protein_coding / is_pseudo=false